MSFHRSVTLSEKALEDLADILVYSKDNWGEKRAEAYIADLEADISALSDADVARQGKTRDDVPRGYLIYPSEQHFLVYRVLDDAVLVARVLHQRMVVSRHVE